MDSKSNFKCDVIIAGGGISGLTSACALAKTGLHVVLIDQKSLTPSHSTNTLTDGRCYAIAYGSHLILQEAGIWEHIKDEASPILDIRVSDQSSSSFLHYNHHLVGELPLGFMVPSDDLHIAALSTIKKAAHVTIMDNITIEHIERNSHNTNVTLSNNIQIQAALLIAADGKISSVRTSAAIPTITHDYKQTAIVCTIEHEKHHHHLAQERFLKTGPFAALPLKGGHHSSLVWVERTPLAPLYLEMNPDECAEQIQKRLGNYLGKISIVSPRFSYPLTLVHAKYYTDTRLALIGDATHGIHPLAGQGLNLGIRDIGVLSTLIKKQVSLGLDIGSPALLKEYESLRKFDSWSLISITHGLNYLFESNLLPIKFTRRLGMAIINRLPSVKARLMRHAMGI